jgi:hypothetical protein
MEVGDVRATPSSMGKSKFLLSLQTYILIFISFVLKLPGSNGVSRSFLTTTNTHLNFQYEFKIVGHQVRVN